jgi:hypothetical protein
VATHRRAHTHARARARVHTHTHTHTHTQENCRVEQFQRAELVASPSVCHAPRWVSSGAMRRSPLPYPPSHSLFSEWLAVALVTHARSQRSCGCRVAVARCGPIVLVLTCARGRQLAHMCTTGVWMWIWMCVRWGGGGSAAKQAVRRQLEVVWPSRMHDLLFNRETAHACVHALMHFPVVD